MFFRKSIGAKLWRWFLWISLLPALIVGYLSYSNARANLQEAIINRLTLTAVEKESGLVDLANSYKRQVDAFSSNQILQTLLQDFNRIQEGKPVDRRGSQDEIEFFLAVEVEEFHRAADFSRSLIIGKRGKVFIDTLGPDAGKDYSKEEIFRKGLEKTFVEYRLDPEGRPYLIAAGAVFPHSLVHEEEIGVLVLEATINETRKLLLRSGKEREREITLLLDSAGRPLFQSSMAEAATPSPSVLEAVGRKEERWMEEGGS